MKIIFSRKGFDSQYGGMASPIFPDGTILPLPIPNENDNWTLNNLYAPGIDVEKVISDLSRGRLSANARVHHDPDLARSVDGRPKGWRPSFGQCGTALRHLQRSGIAEGDVFLFFGWFRQIEIRNGVWIYGKGAPNIHMIFGWLEVDKFFDLTVEGDKLISRNPWIAAHPHLSSRYNAVPGGNGLYVAAKRSQLSASADHGGGRFLRYSASLRLTDKLATVRSIWSLPGWFYPRNSNQPPQLTYHQKIDRWERRRGCAIVQSVAKGQEFVFCSRAYPQAIKWVRDIVRENTA